MNKIIQMLARLSSIWRYSCVGGSELSIQTKCVDIYVNLRDAWKTNTPIEGIRGSRVVAAKKLSVLYPMNSDELKFTDSSVEKFLEDKIVNEIKDCRFNDSLATDIEKSIVRVMCESHIKAYVGELIKVNIKLRNTKIAVVLMVFVMLYRFWEMNIQLLGLPTVLCLVIFTACLAEVHDDLKKGWGESLEDIRKSYNLKACEIVQGWKVLVERDKLLNEVGTVSSKKKVGVL